MKTRANGKPWFVALHAAIPRPALVELLEPRRLMSAPYSLIDVAPFNSSAGYQSLAGLVHDSSGTLYGTTKLGGVNSLGTVFKVANGSSAVTTIASFDSSSGGNPTADLVLDNAGNLYGTTAYGGANNQGTVFEVHAGGSTVLPLASFNSAANNIASVKLAVDALGNVYGITPLGGANSVGCIFEVASGSGTITTLASFSAGTGDYPSSGLVMDGSGDLFGTTPRDGADGFGSIYELPAGSSTITVLAPFTSVNSNVQASSLTIDGSGNLFGTTQFGGGFNNGSIYELPMGGHTINTLASFNVSNGADPSSGVYLTAGGNLIGTTAAGGPSGDGTVYQLNAGSGTITVLANFTGGNGAPGHDSYSNNAVMPDIIGDGHGNYYGVAPAGAPGNLGAVFEVTPNYASQLAITQQPSGSITAGTSQAIWVALETPTGAVASNTQGSVTLSITSGPTGATLGGLLTVSSASGIAAFSSLIFHTAGTYVITASSTGLTPASTTSFTVNPAPASTLVILQQPTAANAGQGIGTIMAAIEDSYGNVITANTSLVSISDHGGPLLNGSTSTHAVAGVATFAGISINQAGTLALQLSDGSLASANTSSFTISPAVAGILVLAQQPAAFIVAGQAIGPLTVNVEDIFGNIETGDLSTINISANPGIPIQGTASMKASSGVATFTGLSIQAEGTYLLSFTDGSLPAANTSSFSVTPAAATQLTIITEPSASAVAGQSIGGLTVAIQDHFGNTVTNNSSSVLATIQSAASIIGTSTAVAARGVATFTDLSVDQTGSYTLNLSVPGLAPATTGVVTIAPAAASHLFVNQQSLSVIAGNIIEPLVVSVQDSFGNVVTTDSSMVTVATVDGTPLLGTLSQPAIAGVATFSDLSMTITGSYALSLSDGNLTPVSTGDITITPAPAARLAIYQQPTDALAGQPIGQMVVDVEDRFGNTVTGDQSTVLASIHPAAPAIAASNATAVNGVATFANLQTYRAGTYTFKATDAGLAPAISDAFEVFPLPVPSLPQRAGIAGQRLAPIVVNVKTQIAKYPDLPRTVSLQVISQSTHQVVLHRTLHVAHGLLKISNLNLHFAGVYTLIISDADGQLATQTLTVFGARANRLQFVSLPTTLSGGLPVSIRVVDRYGNQTAQADGKTVKLTLRWHVKNTKPMTQVVTAIFADGIATFTTLSVAGPGRGRFTASSGGLRELVSPIIINA